MAKGNKSKAKFGVAEKRRLIDELRKRGVEEKKNFWRVKTAELKKLIKTASNNNETPKPIKNNSVKEAPASIAPAKSNKNKVFYESFEWRRVRYAALVKHGAVCQCCGATRADGVRLHVDHIKPRSKYPELELKLDNLQILCEPCNLGKSAIDETDWRPVSS